MADFGAPRELSELQKKRTEYQPQLPPCLQVPLGFFSYIFLIQYFHHSSKGFSISVDQNHLLFLSSVDVLKKLVNLKSPSVTPFLRFGPHSHLVSM